MPYLMDDVATWVHSKWGVIRKAYIECIFTTKNKHIVCYACGIPIF